MLEPNQDTEGDTSGMESKIVNASPTKRFFIEMLTRDVDLLDAITDLIDNSVDGARNLRQNSSFAGLSVEVTVTSETFRIKDNCGGIEVDHARNYAFRFGRPGEAPEVKGSVGQFGVGMKRSFFKLGSSFSVRSTAPHSKFYLEVDVEEWKKDDSSWTFDLSEASKTESEQESCGTEIQVGNLHPDVAKRLGLQNFEKDLVRALESAHAVTMERGLVMRVNTKSLNGHIIKLLSSQSITPAFREYTLFEDTDSPLHARFYCGIFEDKNPSASGWHIFCNGRMIIEGDTTPRTGWGEEGQAAKIPRWHPQYSRFRGYLFLDSEDASRMPWNTTKSGIDFDSEVYQKVKLDMVELMRPVVDFLNKLKDERQENRNDRSRGPLAKMVKESAPTALSELKTTKNFGYTAPVVMNLPRTVNIQYAVSEEELELVKASTKARSARDAGYETFQYYIRKECR